MSTFKIGHPSKVCAPQKHCITETYSDADIERFLSNKDIPAKHKDKIRNAAKYFLIDQKIGDGGGWRETRHAAAVLLVTALIGGGVSYAYSSIRYALLIGGWLPELCGTNLFTNFLHDIAQTKIGGPTCYNKQQQWRDTMQYLMGPTGLLSAYGLTTQYAKKNFNSAVHKTERLIAEWSSTTPPKSLSKKSDSHDDSAKCRMRAAAFDKVFAVTNKHNPPVPKLPIKKMEDAVVGLFTKKKSSSSSKKKTSSSPKRLGAAKKTSSSPKRLGVAAKRSFKKATTKKKAKSATTKSSGKKPTRRNSTRRR